MKTEKEYVTPMMEIMEFETEDIITTSDPTPTEPFEGEEV